MVRSPTIAVTLVILVGLLFGVVFTNRIITGGNILLFLVISFMLLSFATF